MDNSNDHQDIILEGVTPFYDDEIGRGAYGKVYTVDYYGTICAAKEIHPVLVQGTGQDQAQQIAISFVRECRQCFKLRHPNIIQFLGVFYPYVRGVAEVCFLPVMVMELMENSLKMLVEKYENIPLHIKFSIVHDVSLGLRYLHYHSPPIVHSDLFSNNILLTAHHVAKISDVGVAKVINATSSNALVRALGSVDFMPPESLTKSPVYNCSVDVFSFAGIILHTFTQQWPSPSEQVKFDPATRNILALSEVQRRQDHLNKMKGEAELLRPLVETCLDNDPAERPTIATVCENIRMSRGALMNELKDPITLHRKFQQKDKEKVELGTKIEQLQTAMEQLQTAMKQMKDDINVKDAEIKRLKSEIENMPSTPNDVSKDEATNLSIQEAVERDLTQEDADDVTEAAMEISLHEAASTPTQDVAEQLQRVPLEYLGDSHESATILKTEPEAPLLIPALTSGEYTIKWTKLADLPAPMWAPYVAVHDRKVYIAGGNSSDDEAFDQVYEYDITSNRWSQLPPPGHYYGIPHIIDNRLAIIGGFKSTSNKRTNKVSTFDDTSQTWMDFYPDLTVARSSPGVVTHLDHVIVAGGRQGSSRPKVQDDIEILNWTENTHWRVVDIHLPVPMWGFTPVIFDDNVFIAGFCGHDLKHHRRGFKIPTNKVIGSQDPPATWTRVAKADHFSTALVPSVYAPLLVGGETHDSTPTMDITLYDPSTDSWQKIASLSSARFEVAVAPINDNAIMVIGGCTVGGDVENAKSSCLTTVELGQVILK